MKKIAIVGNSNCVMRNSFVSVLDAEDGLDVRNFSIGSTPSVLLLHFLAQNPDLDFDVIIVETCVNDWLHGSGRCYSPDSAREAFDVFLSTARARSSAQVILVTIPTRPALTTKASFWPEEVHREAARKHGVPLLDGYGLVRSLLGGRRKLMAPDIFGAGRYIGKILELPQWEQEEHGWRALLDARAPGNALAVLGFQDNAHFGKALHKLVAEILIAYISRTAGRAKPKRNIPLCPVVSVEPRSGCPRSSKKPQPLKAITRESSLITETLVQLSCEQSVTYPVEPGWRAAGVLVNKGSTRCLTVVAADGGETVIDNRFRASNLSWNAIVLQIEQDIGDGDVSITARAEVAPETALKGIPDAGDPVNPLGIELGKMVFVRRDWRETLAPSLPEPPECVDIVELESTKTVIAGFTDMFNLALSVDEGIATAEHSAFGDLLKSAVPAGADFVSIAKHAYRMYGPSPEFEQVISAWTAKQERDERPGQIRTELEILDRARAPSLGQFVSLAWEAHHAKQFERAVELWASCRDVGPNHHAGLLGGAFSLRALGRRAEAAELIAIGLEKMPYEFNFWFEHAVCAWQDGAAEEAFSRLAAGRERFPAEARFYSQGVAWFKTLGRDDEAAALQASLTAVAAPIG